MRAGRPYAISAGKGRRRPSGRRASPRLRALSALALGLCITMLALSAGPGHSQTAPIPDPDRRLLSTGQSQGYRGNTALASDGNGDDGDLIRGRLFDFRLAPVIPPTRQEENLLVDAATGLMWLRSLSALDLADERGAHANHRLDRTYTWDQALDVAEDFIYAGHDDWRLPNVHELQTLVDFGHWAPALDPEGLPEPFEALPSPYFWSSTTSPTHAGEAYYSNALDGHAWPWSKSYAFSVRPLRSLTEAERLAYAIEPEPERVLLLASGQVQRYRRGREIVEPGGGDDGDYRLGQGPRYSWRDDGRIDRADENLVVDEGSGLEWLRRPQLLDGRGSGEDPGPDGLGGTVDLSQPLDWQAAVEACNALDYAGRSDWRLPNIRELDSLAQYGRQGAALDPEAFAEQPAPARPLPPEKDHQPPWIWWSSTSNVRPRPGLSAADEAWYLSIQLPLKRHHVFDDQSGGAKTKAGYARCVRDAAPRARPDGWLTELRSSADWRALGIESRQVEIARLGKFMLPLDSAGAPFAAAFQDAGRYPLHLDFLRAAFPERFGSLSPADYESLVARRSTRRYLAGGLREFESAGLGRVYGFEVYVEEGLPGERLSQDEVAAIHARLGRYFRRRPLFYSPTQPEAAAEARLWAGQRPPVAFPAPPPDPGYTAYTPGETYGRIRRMRLDQLRAASDAGQLSWQDILVLEATPSDVEGVVAGVVTAERQGDLSHLNVRLARRGTPNAYLADAPARLAAYEGRLVRLTLSRDGWHVQPEVDPAEAEAHWASRRPEPVPVPAYDAAALAIEDLARIAAGERDGDAVGRVGAKAANLARLYAILPAEHALPGLAIPFGYYREFMASNTILDPEVDPPATRSLADHLVLLHANPRFVSDSAWRAQRLARLREAIRDGAVPDAWESAIEMRLIETFGPRTMVRFRSSSNAEDGLDFNGAGLYDSTSVCAEDGSDGDGDGPSRCDPDQPEERTIKRGLRKVWASLWSGRAWEERAWYGMDPLAPGMAILVTPAFADEAANGVAFTGNPLSPGRSEMLVNAQLGDASVVLPDPGLLPERSLLSLASGRIIGIRRLQASSLLPAGDFVLDDARLLELGRLMLDIDARFPLELGGRPRSSVLLDLEFKIRADDESLRIKQIRPFALPTDEVVADSSFLRLIQAQPLQLCSGWRLPYPIAEEFAEQMVLDLPASDLRLSLDDPIGDWTPFGALRFGPDLLPLAPAGPGEAKLEPVAGRPDLRTLRFSRRYGTGGAAVDLELRLPELRAGEPNLRRLDGAALGAALQIAAQAAGRAPHSLSPCGLAGRPDEHLDLELDGGGTIGLRWRYAGEPGLAPQTQAELLEAWVRLPEGERRIEGFGSLAYDAGRHNWDERFLMRFALPLGEAHGLLVSQDGIAGRPETRTRAELLDADMRAMRPLPVRNARRYSATPIASPTPTPSATATGTLRPLTAIHLPRLVR